MAPVQDEETRRRPEDHEGPNIPPGAREQTERPERPERARAARHPESRHQEERERLQRRGDARREAVLLETLGDTETRAPLGQRAIRLLLLIYCDKLRLMGPRRAVPTYFSFSFLRGAAVGANPNYF